MPAVSYSEFEHILSKARGASSTSLQAAAFKSLQDFAHSGNRPQQAKASKHLPEFYQICKEHQGDIHDLILDLCEDNHADVRMAGYRALLDLSEREPSLRRKNIDVFCQLLQNDDESELRLIRASLSQLIRMDPATAYSIINESMVSKSENGETRCYLMAAMISFLSGGGISFPTIPTDVELFRQQDMLGGKGAILEVSWVQKNTSADEVLLSGIAQALSVTTIDEARILIMEILFSLSNECIPLAEGTSKILKILISKAHRTSQEDMHHVPCNMQITLDWLRLCELTIAATSSPLPRQQADSSIARANPLPMLQAFNIWIIPSRLKVGDTSSRADFLRLLGVVLKACREIMQTQEHATRFAPLKPLIIQTRNTTIDLADPILSTWTGLVDLEESIRASICITELFYAISERQRDSDWRWPRDQGLNYQNVRRRALGCTDGLYASQFQEIVQSVDSVLTSPAESHQVGSLPRTPIGRSESLNSTRPFESRKRTRKDAVDAGRGIIPLGDDEKIIKRQRLGKEDLLTRINLMRVSAAPPDTIVAHSLNQPVSARSSLSPLPIPQQPSSADSSSFSIRGAALPKAPADAGNPESLGHRISMIESRPTQSPPPILARLGGTQPMSRSSSDINKTKALISTSPHPGFSDINDSIHQLLHGKSQDTGLNMQRLSKNKASVPPASTLLARLASEGTLRDESSKGSIFDRLGVSPGSHNQSTSIQKRRGR